MADGQVVMQTQVPQHLSKLAEALEAGPERLVLGDEELSNLALAATKDIFDLAISFEPISHVHLHPFIQSVQEPPTTRSRGKDSKDKAATPPPVPQAEDILPYTPLGELTYEGLDAEQVWQQLEIRGKPMTEVIKSVIDVDAMNEDDEEGGIRELDDDEDDSEEDDDEPLDLDNLSPEEIEKLMSEAQDWDSDEEGDSDEEDEDDGSDSDDEDGSDEEDGVRFYSDEEGASDVSGSDDGSDLEMGSNEELDLEDGEEDEDEEDEEDEEEDDDMDDGEEEEDDDADDAEADRHSLSGPSLKRQHPTLDDGFFSIDVFNRSTEELEAGRVTGGRLGGDDDDEEDDAFAGDISSLMLRGAPEEDSIMYSDFFEPPRPQFGAGGADAKGKGKGKGKALNGEAKGKGKGKSKQKARFAQEEEDEENEEDADDMSEGSDEERGIMGRVKGDLFDDEDEEVEEQNLSNHEKRQRALAEQIAELESEAIGPKDWTLLGEATSRARPENSLLEEVLDFEQMGKVVPVITEETVKSLEDMIKARIIDNNFDSPVRVRAYEPTPFLPSRYFELQDTQSSKSLAQIYEDEYQTAAAGGAKKDPRDEKLKKEHDEIQRVWDEICYKLDALSSLNFVPKQPKAQISTISNLPTTSMETALPPTSSAATLLAPQEVFAGPSAAGLVSRSELTPEEAQKARQKHRKAKQVEKRKLDGMAELYGAGAGGKKKRKSAREEKEEALKSLVKTGKGVTVVGKGDKETNKAQNRQNADGAQADGKWLKL